MRNTDTGMTCAELLDALRSLARNIEVKHEHVVRHEPIPKPERAMVVIKRDDNSEAWRGLISVGPRFMTSLTVPLSNINPRFSRGEALRLEFEWER